MGYLSLMSDQYILFYDGLTKVALSNFIHCLHFLINKCMYDPGIAHSISKYARIYS